MRKSAAFFFLIWITVSALLGFKAIGYMLDFSWIEKARVAAFAVVIGGLKGIFVLRKAAKKMCFRWETQKKKVLVRFFLLLCVMQLMVVVLKLMHLSELIMATVDLSIAFALVIGAFAFLSKEFICGRSS